MTEINNITDPQLEDPTIEIINQWMIWTLILLF